VTIAHDAQRLSSDLPTTLRLLVPNTIPHLPCSLEVLPRKGNDLRHDKLGDGTGVGEGGIEDGDTRLRGGDEVYLIGADAKATNRKQLDRGERRGKPSKVSRCQEKVDLLLMRT